MFAPYHPKILNILDHFVRSFRRFPTTVGHSSSEAVIIRPRHLDDYTKVSGRPYACKACSVLSPISSSAIL